LIEKNQRKISNLKKIYHYLYKKIIFNSFPRPNRIFLNIKGGTERSIYIIRESETDRFRRCREFDCYLSANLKYLRIYGR
jgi:hypothetical protein